MIDTPHGSVTTPFFMPVGTVGSVKGISPDEIKDMNYECVLSNTYHLFLRPGEKNIKKLGGLHKFMGWDKAILTDSGGYQVFSLGERKYNDKFLISNDKSNPKFQNQNHKKSLVKITPDGVEFTSHLDGSKHFFTPEKVVQIQLDLGVDMIMPLDVCPHGKATKKEVEKAVELTLKWAQRSKKYFTNKLKSYQLQSNKRPGLFAIVQGGLDLKLREYCAKKLIETDFDGYAIGGLAVDIETRNMWDVVKLMGKILPENKPRYLMGVGTPDDIEKAISFGIDMFDCVLPTRLARHGSVYVKKQDTRNNNPARNATHSVVGGQTNSKNKIQKIKYCRLNLLQSKYRLDKSTIEKGCGCYTCKNGFSKAYISHLIREKEMLGMRLATLHNLYKYKKVVEKNLTK